MKRLTCIQWRIGVYMIRIRTWLHGSDCVAFAQSNNKCIRTWLHASRAHVAPSAPDETRSVFQNEMQCTTSSALTTSTGFQIVRVLQEHHTACTVQRYGYLHGQSHIYTCCCSPCCWWCALGVDSTSIRVFHRNYWNLLAHISEIQFVWGSGAVVVMCCSTFIWFNCQYHMVQL